MSDLEVLTAPHPILTTRAKEIDVVDNSICQLMDDMLSCMYKSNGVGLAANQVGILKRIIIIDLQDNDETTREKEFHPLYIANPKILSVSDEVVEMQEGCLSLPEQRIDITRPESIKIKFLDYHNKVKELQADGWLARAIQHEIDHLDGKLMLDYISKMKKDIILRKLKKTKDL